MKIKMMVAAVLLVPGMLLAAEGTISAKSVFFGPGGQLQVTSAASVPSASEVAVTPAPAPAPVSGTAQEPSRPSGMAPVSASAGAANKPPRPGPAGAAASPYGGIAFWADVTTLENRTVRATTAREFRSGETVRLYFKPNVAGYLYVFNKGSTGKTRLLYPAQGEDNRIQGGQVVSVPGKDRVLRFDKNPGKEKLVAVLTRRPLADLIPAVATPPSAEKPRMIEAEVNTGKLEVALNSAVSKDLILEQDAAPVSGFQPASYVVAPLADLDKGKLISLEIVLQHR